MKKSVFLLPLMLLGSLVSCDQPSSSMLTYGTYINDEAISIDGSTLKDKLNQENFLLVVHPEDGSCGCWTYFDNTIKSVTKLNNLLFYKVIYTEIDDELYGKGFERFNNKPSFYIVSDGKISNKYEYGDNKIFTDNKALYDQIVKNIKLPKMYFIDEEMLLDKKNEESIIYYQRSSCTDCSYCTPNVLMPYLNKYEGDKLIYVIDLDPYRIDQTTYQEFKDNHHLSNVNDSIFGYKEGYVPTFQYYNNNQLIDMCVYFNDTIENGVIASSYYDEDRINYLEHAKNIENNILTGLSIPKEYLNSEESYWINNDAHAKYYNKYINSFLDLYL